MSLQGITRRAFGSAPIPNPILHLPMGLQNKVIIEQYGPDGALKKRVEQEGNYMVDYGLSRVATLLATGTYAGSLFAGGLCLGTGTTAATNNQTALVASTAGAGTFTPAVSGVSMNYAATFASGTTGVINEIGLFQSSASFNASMIARLVLTGTQVITLGVSDTVNATYQVVAKTAA